MSYKSGLFNDIKYSIAKFSIWNLLARQDIRQRYRRSALGPFWITLSMVISIVAIGLVYGNLFGVELSSYLPYLTVGFIVWSFISVVVVESCGVLTSSESIIKQIKLPFGVYIFRMVWRNLIILGHHSIVLIIVISIFGAWADWSQIVLFPVALLINLVAAVLLSYIMGAICCRYRDVAQIVNSLMQVIFYITPVIWKPDVLKSHRWLLDFNPFYYFLEIIRYTLINSDVFNFTPWIGSVVCILLLYFVAMFIYKHSEYKIALWL